MNYYLVATIAHVWRQQSAFTYQSEAEFSIGAIVIVPVGKKEVPGIVIQKISQKPSFTTKSIVRLIESTPLPVQLIQLASWMSDYYKTHPAEVWQTILPRGVQKKRRKTQRKLYYPERERTKIVLNDEQIAAITRVQNMSPGTALLRGVTGSGKTQVYIELAKRTMQQGMSSIVVVPEIALTSQLIAEFNHHFAHIIITHSAMSEAERHIAWQQCLTSPHPLIVIGPRSALFSPLKKIGLIIIDECHEPSLKQEQSPRYSALRTASMLSQFHQGRLVLGSATPSIADSFLAQASQRPTISLSRTARSNAQPPKITVVDMKQKESFTKHRFFSTTLLEQIESTFSNGHQSLIFHNRRGSAPTTLCESCGWTANCYRCFTPLTLHNDHFELRCHICNYKEKVPTACPTCQTTDIIHKGIGTKLITEELQKLFPKANIARFDTDTIHDQRVENRYQELYNGSIDIIVGTQVIAKGLDLPRLRTVGIIQADSGLSLPDYQSSERVFQLIAQVRGRIGRSHHASRMIIQSYQPRHPSIVYGIEQNYDAFYREAIKERKRGAFPPFVYLLKLTCIYKTEAGAIRACRDLAKKLREVKHDDITILGPSPAFYERVRDTFRWQLILKSPRREHLVNILDSVPDAKWQVELDPVSLL